MGQIILEHKYYSDKEKQLSRPVLGIKQLLVLKIRGRDMMISFKKLDYNDMEVFKEMAKWYNDKEIQHYFIPNFIESDLEDIKPEELRYHSTRRVNKSTYLIWDKELLIGELSIDLDFEDLLKKEPKTAWISICIGNKSYWGKGVGILGIKFIEDTCKDLGIKRIELGVFEYNIRAHRLYKKLGYMEFGIISDFVCYKGNWYSDIRMEKYL